MYQWATRNLLCAATASSHLYSLCFSYWSLFSSYHKQRALRGHDIPISMCPASRLQKCGLDQFPFLCAGLRFESELLWLQRRVLTTIKSQQATKEVSNDSCFLSSLAELCKHCHLVRTIYRHWSFPQGDHYHCSTSQHPLTKNDAAGRKLHAEDRHKCSGGGKYSCSFWQLQSDVKIFCWILFGQCLSSNIHWLWSANCLQHPA